MKKKQILIIFSAVLAAVIITALAIISSNYVKPAKNDDEFLPTEKQFDLSALKDAKLTIFFEARSNNAMAEVLQAVNEKLKSELKAELSFEMIWDYPENYYARIRETIAAGGSCDAFFYHPYLPLSLEEMAENGIAADLTSRFPENAPNYYSQFTGEEIDAIRVNGKLYAIPGRIPTTDRICAIVRDQLMKKYGIQEIKSYDDYENYLAAVKKNETGLIPMCLQDTTIGLFSSANGYVTLNYDLGLVYRWNDPSMKLMAWEQTPEYTAGLNRIKSWKDKGYLMPGSGMTDISDSTILGGRWASFLSNYGNETQYNILLAQKGISDYKYIACQLYDGYTPRNSPLESALVINAKSNNIDRVLMFIDWLQSKQENYDLLMYGVKGKHYTDMGDYIVQDGGSVKNSSFIQWGWTEPFRNIDLERSRYPRQKEDMSRYKEIMEKKTRFPPHIGFRPNYSEGDNLVSARAQALDTIDRHIYAGTFKPEDTDSFIKEQKNSGIQNLIDVIQKQLNDYRNGR